MAAKGKKVLFGKNFLIKPPWSFRRKLQNKKTVGLFVTEPGLWFIAFFCISFFIAIVQTEMYAEISSYSSTD